MRRWLGFALALWTLSCAARGLADDETTCDGSLQSDSFRYPTTRVFPRIAVDIAAVPASAVAWDAGDWSRFGAFAAPTLAFMWPARPSLDTELERWLQKHQTTRADRAFLKIDTIPFAATLAGYGAALFATAWATDDDRLFEFGTLQVETLAVVQFWHVTTKLLIGRDAPYTDPQADGAYHGPTQIHFPGGTPSGHAATMYGMLAVAAEYWKKKPLYALMHIVGLYSSLSLVYHQQHFISDVLWGAAMGFYTARWVVRHRSSLYRCKKRTLSDRMLIVPVWAAGSFGLTLTVKL